MFKKTREKSPYFHLAIDFGYTLLASVGIFGYAGWYLGQRSGGTPWFLVGGIGLGIIVGFYSLFRRLNLLEARSRAEREQEKRKPQRSPDDPKS